MKLIYTQLNSLTLNKAECSEPTNREWTRLPGTQSWSWPSKGCRKHALRAGVRLAIRSILKI